VTSVSPDQAVSRIGDPPGGPAATLDLTLAGSGFATVSQCHLAGPDHPDEGLVTALSGGSLRCTVDLGVLQPGAYELWVVNAGTVASNRIPFTVLTTDPVLASISPTGGQSGTLSSITATGSGFDASSVVLLDGQPFGRTTFVSGTRLYAAPLDLKSVPLGTHQVTVANGGRVSAPQVFTVTEAPPFAAGIVPGSARQGATVQVTVTGSGFGSSPRLRVVDPGGTAQELTPSSASATEVKASFTFASAGEYLWTVVNSAGSSDALPFRALSNVAVLAGLTPATAPQGAEPTLTLTAQNLEAGARLHLTGPGQDLDLAATVSLPSTVTASLDLAGWNTGTYSLTVLNPGASASNGLGFSVTPGSPGLTGICVGSGCSPAASACVVQTAQPGANPVQVFLAGSNFARPDAGGNVESAVHAASSSCRTPPGGCDVPDFVLPASAVTVTDAGHLVVDFDTTQAIPDVYDVTVWNPGPTGVLKSPWVTLTVRAGGQACP
jgi:hypothetical protein